MWVWIYRIIAALLAFGGATLFSAAWEELRGRMFEFVVWLGDGLAFALVAFASIL